jgi:hypothetical protein
MEAKICWTFGGGDLPGHFRGHGSALTVNSQFHIQYVHHFKFRENAIPII